MLCVFAQGSHLNGAPCVGGVLSFAGGKGMNLRERSADTLSDGAKALR